MLYACACDILYVTSLFEKIHPRKENKKMKKLSVLIALALCITIGGVYAAWTYATGNVTNNTNLSDISVGMEVEKNSSKGTLTAEFSQTPNFSVEPDTGNVPKLQNNDTDVKLVITFTPDDAAEPDVKTHGIDVTVTLSASGFGQYNSGTDVISVKTAQIDISKGDWTVSDGVLTYEITSDTIIGCLSVDNTKALTTATEAETFRAAVTSGKITINISANE